MCRRSRVCWEGVVLADMVLDLEALVDIVTLQGVEVAFQLCSGLIVDS